MKRSRLIVLFAALFLLLNFPLLSIFNRPILIGGVPLLFAYLFLIWLLTIVLLFRMLDQRQSPK